MAHVLSVQDLSCLGKCSLTVALPVLSAMGCACTPLPTALLSSHTAFPQPYRRSLTADIEKISSHWQSIGASFDTISVGYLADAEQAAAVGSVLDSFSGLKVIDPVLGDRGKLYAGLSDDHVAAMKQLCRKADVLLPNLTEACLLTGIGYRETSNQGYYRQLLQALKELAPAVILTGVCVQGGKIGFMTDEFEVYQAEKQPGHYHGTGDLFTSVFTGAVALGKPLPDAAALAAGFVETVIKATPDATPFGVNFEQCLPWLWERT